MCIRYKHRPVRPEGQTGKGVASRVVTLVVQVHRASGLQAAARYNTHCPLGSFTCFDARKIHLAMLRVVFFGG